MDMDEDKDLAREFQDLLRSKCRDVGAVKGLLAELLSASPEHRLRIAKGLLAIGADRSGRTHDRNFALQQLSTFICKCELPKDHSFERALVELIDDWTRNSQDRGNDIDIKPTGAFITLFTIDQELGLQKLDQTIEQYDGLDSCRELRQLREDLQLMSKGIRPKRHVDE
jgi:hypothetical protein